jgi:hypothetical protein
VKVWSHRRGVDGFGAGCQRHLDLEDVSMTEELAHGVVAPAEHCDLTEVLDAAATCIARPSLSQAKTLQQLNALRGRQK